MPHHADALLAVTLSVTDLAVRRAGRLVVAGVSFTVAPGRALALRGPNGAGKSTLLLAVAGLIGPDAGSIDWALPDADMPAREAMHFVGHLAGVKPALTVAENLAFAADLHGAPRSGIADALARVGLAPLARIEAGLLSAGQTRRLALARLLVAPRPVWLLDEPTSALDADGSALVAMMLQAHLDAGGLCIYATHLDLGVESDPRVATLAVTPLGMLAA